MGRRALVTGGDSGIGGAAATAYARDGTDVAINCLPAEEPNARDVVQLIPAQARKAIAVPGDIVPDVSSGSRSRRATTISRVENGSGASTGCARNPTDSQPTNRFSCKGTLPVGPERSVVTRTASSERKLMLMDAMSEFDASDRNCRIGKRLEAFH